MADKKLSALTTLTSLVDGDLFYVVSSLVSRKLTWADLRKSVLSGGNTYVVAASDAPAKLKAVADKVCDGTADEVEINAALAALPSTGGKVRLTEGTYNIASSILVQQAGAFIEGSGPGARSNAAQAGRGTFIKAATGLTTAVILVQNATNDHPVYGVTIAEVNVDGNSIGTGVDGIVFKSTQGLLLNCYVHNCTGDGMQLEGYNGDELFDTRVVGCNSDHNTGSGIFLNTYAADSRLCDCTLYTNSASGLRVKAGGCQAALGQYYNNSLYGIHFDGGGSQFIATDIKIENNGKEGIYFDAGTTGMEYVEIDGCHFRYNGKSAANTYSHIGGTGNQQCSNVVITGCEFNGRPLQNPDNKGKYGIDIWNSNGPKYWGVFGNVFAQPIANHFGTDALRNAGLNCKVRGNSGCPDSGLMGTGTIAQGTTSIAITHSLPYTPTVNEIIITPSNNPTTDPGHWWVDTITSTQFTVNVRNSLTVGSFTFGWRIA